MPESEREQMSERRWWGIIGALVGVRLAIPLLTLAFSGHGLPGLPFYRYQARNGDSFAYYADAREFIASLGRVSPPLVLLAIVLVVASVVVGVRCWRGEPRRPVLAILLPAGALSFALTLPIHQIRVEGGGTIGWPMLWAIPMFPIRAVGIDPTPDIAFGIGLTLTLCAIAGTIVMTAYLGLYATGRRSIGLIAASALTMWPLVSGQIVGHSAWENGQWNVDVGLHLYTEPLSTAFVLLSVVLLLRPATTSAGGAGAGLAIGYATVTRLTNGLMAVPFTVLVAWRWGWRRAGVYVLGGLLSLPLVAVFWPKGYIGMFDGKAPRSVHFWALSYAGDAWGHSRIFTPRLLILLAPLFMIGCVVMRDRWILAVVLTPIVVNVVVYSLYKYTAIHPRFLYVTFPFLFVLEAAGAVAVADEVRRRRRPQGEVRVL